MQIPSYIFGTLQLPGQFFLKISNISKDKEHFIFCLAEHTDQ
jgi:hypothetical protein